MKLSISNIGWESVWDEQVYEEMQRLGYEGLEIAPTRIFGDKPYEDLNRVASWYESINKRFVISSMQSILYGVSDSIFQGEEQRNNLTAYIYKAIDFARTLSCGNLVFGCPRNRNGSSGGREIAISFFRDIGEYALSQGTVIALEPVPVCYNTDFLNTTKDTVDFIRDVRSDGLKLNFDIGALITSNEDLSVISDNTDIINHVHISEPGLKKIENRSLHTEIRDLLLGSGYNGFLSIEMGKQESVESVIDTLRYVKEMADGGVDVG